MGLGLGRNPPYILNIDAERGENENDLLTFVELGGIIKNHMQNGKKVV